jgi:phosphate transport system protein
MKAFDTDLQDLSRMVAEMETSPRSNRRLDRRAGKARYGWRSVALADANIDALQRELKKGRCSRLPDGSPWRSIFAVGALRLANDLERIGDLAKNSPSA